MKIRYGNYVWDLIRHKKDGHLLWLYTEGRVRVPGEVKTKCIDLDEFEYAFMAGDILERDNKLYYVEYNNQIVLGHNQGILEGVEELSNYKLVQRKA